ncbi:MAG TPA: phosphoribosyltransferase [Thermoanaerobaculia bacterium]|nr:phosphoribosyltransferase [Thermoanaerobaculia bacterium]
MLEKSPRRMQLANEWPKLLHPPPPESTSERWSIVLPFCETLGTAFEVMCSVDTIGVREGRAGRCYTFLRTKEESDFEQVRLWHQTVGQYVALRDCLPLSFALDYDREGGSPKKNQTRIGKLRSRAKPYDGAPTLDTVEAANELNRECLSFLEAMSCYDEVDAVVGMPPSRPDKRFDLPRHLARGISSGLKVADLSEGVVSVERQQLKNVLLADKLSTIRGTIRVVGSSVAGRTVLLVDDLYQSGVTMNYVAGELLSAGARTVLGLACEKTCRNDDNVSANA